MNDDEVWADERFTSFRREVEAMARDGKLASNQIGHDLIFNTADGPSSYIYADWGASGRALQLVEDFLRDTVLPYYANPHTRASLFGRRTNALRAAARTIVASYCGAGEDCSVIFTASGATSGLGKLGQLLGVCGQAEAEGTLILVGPYEHHSNLLPWRMTGSQVCQIREDLATGGPDLRHMQELLESARKRAVVCAFSAGSNVSGIGCDQRAITLLAKSHGAKIVWDYAAAAPYLPVAQLMAEGSADAIVFSPHKFLGGPGAAGVLVVRNTAVSLRVPTQAGGGTVRYVTADHHVFHDSIAAREEAGTPNLPAEIRAALALIVKEAIQESPSRGTAMRHLHRARRSLAACAHIEMLAPDQVPVLPFLPIRVRKPDQGHVHHQLITRLLSDHCGIQVRGGCACAGPYVHRLLGIDEQEQANRRDLVLQGREDAKPGFVRICFSDLHSEEEVDRIISALAEMPMTLRAARENYRLDRATAIFHPRSGDRN